MKKLVITIVGAVTSASLCASGAVNPEAELRVAVARLAASDNYTWTTTLWDGLPPKPAPQTVGKITKDGRMYKVTTNAASASGFRAYEEAMAGGRLAHTGLGLGLWTLITNPSLRKIDGVFHSATEPAVVAEILLGKVRTLKSADGVFYYGDLTEEGARTIVAMAGRDGRMAFSLAGAKGTARFWCKNGVLTKFECRVEGNGGPYPTTGRFLETATVEITGIGMTRVELPASAERVLVQQTNYGIDRR